MSPLAHLSSLLAASGAKLSLRAVAWRANCPDLSIKQAGQIIVLFALMLTFMIGLVGIAIDVTSAWRNGLQIQRSADAAALAGVVYLPGDLASATDRATKIALSNGYGTSNGGTITIAPNPDNDRQLDVSITAKVPTYFVTLFGINNWTITRAARGAYVMPVPMGSPLAYYGVGCFVLTSPATAPPCSIAANNGAGLSGLTDGSTTFTNLGGWGAIITKGGNANNGDAYGPYNNVGYTPAVNALYDPDGYYYSAVLPAGGSLKVFDPGFCAMGANSSGAGSLGAGDHWISGSNTPVSTYYTLWNTNGMPLYPPGWTQIGASSGTLFENQKGMDTANGGSGGTGGCDAYHNKWWTLASSLSAGTYEIQVATTNPNNASINQSTNAENMFSLEATGGSSPTVYGLSRMAAYNNMAGSASGQQFYLAKIDAASGAGKTLEIDLFDPGDVSGNGYLKLLSPNGTGGTQTQVTNFRYTTDGNCRAGVSDACSGSNESQIQTANNGSSSFQSTWIHIFVPLNTAYGSTGLWRGGWWQVQYITGAANDTTTWSVNIIGNPVHLVPIG